MSYFFKMTFTTFSYFVFCIYSIGIVTYANISMIKQNPKFWKKSEQHTVKKFLTDFIQSNKNMCASIGIKRRSSSQDHFNNWSTVNLTTFKKADALAVCLSGPSKCVLTQCHDNRASEHVMLRKTAKKHKSYSLESAGLRQPDKDEHACPVWKGCQEKAASLKMNVAMRLRFTKFLNKPQDFWNNVFYIDRTKVELFRTSAQTSFFLESSMVVEE